MTFILFCLFVALNFPSQSLQQTKNPITDFCRRFGHQTAVIDRKLYIDGGLVNWNPISQNPLNYTNTWLLYNDLDSTGSAGGMPQIYSNLTKNNTVPSVSGGILWADDVNKVFYQYGGEYQTSPETFAFWAYDTLLNQWNLTSGVPPGIERVSWGAGATINDLGYGFYYGGWLNAQNTPGWGGLPMATSSLIKYDMNANAWTNNTGPDNTGRAEGVMVYLPASDGGLLVYFGGIEDPYKNGTIVGANMSNIHVFDVASSKWYAQNATGEIPDMRRKFCAGATWAADHSSYNIYLYGGQGINNITGFDDAYILSLPSFTWIKVYPSSGEGSSPHGLSSCNVIDNSQMLVIGGYFAENQNCDSPDVWGTHNMNLGEDGPENALWDKYYPNITKYLVPTPVISAVGGGPTGGATATKPAGNWSNPDLQVYFTRVPTFTARSATRVISTGTLAPSPSSTGNGTAPASTSHVGAIAGGAVGGAAVLIAILCAILFCLHRHKKSLKNRPKKPVEVEAAPVIPPTELPANSPVAEMGPSSNSKWGMPHSPGQQSVAPSYASHNHSHPGSPMASQHGYSPNQNHVSPAYQTPASPYGPQHTQGAHFAPTPTTPHTAGSYSGTYPPNYPQGNYPQNAYPQGTFTGDYQEQQYHQQLPPEEHQQYPYEQRPQNPPYDPSQHAMHQEHFPPPPTAEARSPGGNSEAEYTPTSKSSTPAHFYPQPLAVPRRSLEGSVDRRPIQGRFIEEDD